MAEIQIHRSTPRGGDNYSYLLQRNNSVLWVDPLFPLGNIKKIQKNGWKVEGILITHTHWDHIDGLEQVLEAANVPVYVHPLDANIVLVNTGSKVPFDDIELSVTHLPGHHPAHVAFIGAGIAVVGDILFRGGCGSPLFGGNMDQIYESLRALPTVINKDDTVLWGHNYDATNLSFCKHYWPTDSAISSALDTTSGLEPPQLPELVTFSQEQAVNPFLRLDEPALHQALSAQNPALPNTPRDLFFELRTLRNTWRGEP